MEETVEHIALEIVKDFRFAHGGRFVREYQAGQTVAADPELAKVALAEKWAKKAKTAAPENKALAPEETKEGGEQKPADSQEPPADAPPV